MREEFEACLLNEFAKDLKKKADFPEGMAEAVVKAMIFERREDGEYAAVVPRERWIGWQASRAALVVELPPRVDAKPYACYENGWNDMHGEAREAIEAAGVKVAS